MHYSSLKYVLSTIVVATFGIMPLAIANFTLSWSDRSHNEDGFAVERSKDGENFEEIARVGRNVETYSDTELLEDQRLYYYRVRAFNEFGSSGYTNIGEGLLPEIFLTQQGFVETSITVSGPSNSNITRVSSHDESSIVFEATASGFAAYDDDLRFAYVPASDDFSLVVEVDSPDYLPHAARAGIMVRQNLDSNANRTAISIDGSGRVQLNWRPDAGLEDKVEVIHNSETTRYLAMFKVGSLLTLAHSSDGKNWIQDKVSIFHLHGQFLVGLAASSGSKTSRVTAGFRIVDMENLQLQSELPDLNAKVLTTVVRVPHSKGFYEYEQDVGLHSFAFGGSEYGRLREDFRYSYVPFVQDGMITVRIVNFADAHPDSQTGIMFRSSLNPDAAYVAVSVSPTKDIFVNWRTDSTQSPQFTPLSLALVGEPFIRMTRTGDKCSIEASTDGFDWTAVYTVDTQLGNESIAGLFLSAGGNAIATSTMEVVESNIPLLEPSLTDYRGSRNDVAIGRSDSEVSSTYDPASRLFRLEANGKGFGTVRDQLIFSYWQATEHFRIVARVHEFDADRYDAQTGVMVRGSNGSQAVLAAITVNGRGNIETLYRENWGSMIVSQEGQRFEEGGYLALERVGSTVTSLYSADGVNWTTISTNNLSLPEVHHIGIVLGAGRGISSSLLEVTGLR